MIDFAAEQAVMSDSLFELLAELAAETWHKAAARWQKRNNAPLRFVSVASADTATFLASVAADCRHRDPEIPGSEGAAAARGAVAAVPKILRHPRYRLPIDRFPE